MATNKNSDVKLTLPKSPELYAAIFRDYYGALLQSTGREGMSNLLELLSSQGYFSSRCARHHKFVGGTLQHSLEVCHYMLEHNRDQLDRNNIIIVALLHDVCNIQGYGHISRHGSRSVRIVRDVAHIELTNDEEQAILWHMHGHRDAGKLGLHFDECLQNNKLHRLLREADGHSAAHGLSRPELEQMLEDLEDSNNHYIRHWFTPSRISHLNANQIFVFGSNLQGMHGGGAARYAMDHFGAVYGEGVGRTGQCYAIPTMHGGVEAIRPYVDEFIAYAAAHPELEFLVTPIGCGIAGFTEQEIAPLFCEALKHGNIILPEGFVREIEKKNN